MRWVRRCRDDAELDLGLAKLGIVGGDVRRTASQLAAAAERKARNRRDDRLARIRRRVPGAAKITYNAATAVLSAISLMSAPAANACPEPVSRMQPMPGSAS